MPTNASKAQLSEGSNRRGAPENMSLRSVAVDLCVQAPISVGHFVHARSQDLLEMDRLIASAWRKRVHFAISTKGSSRTAGLPRAASLCAARPSDEIRL